MCFATPPGACVCARRAPSSPWCALCLITSPLCVWPGPYAGSSPLLAALDAHFPAHALSSRPSVAHGGVEYLTAAHNAASALSAIRDSDDTTAVGVVEAGGKENTIARIVQHLSWCVAAGCGWRLCSLFHNLYATTLMRTRTRLLCVCALLSLLPSVFSFLACGTSAGPHPSSPLLDCHAVCVC